MTEHDAQNVYSFWRVWIPAIALLTVALAQVTLATTAELCPWKGGGFGMFATTDATAGRHVRVFVQRETSFEELENPPPESLNETQAKLFPSDGMLTRLALAVVSGERSAERPVNAVRLEVWRTEFGIGSLEATNRLVRRFTYRVYENGD